MHGACVLHWADGADLIRPPHVGACPAPFPASFSAVSFIKPPFRPSTHPRLCASPCLLLVEPTTVTPVHLLLHRRHRFASSPDRRLQSFTHTALEELSISLKQVDEAVGDLNVDMRHAAKDVGRLLVQVREGDRGRARVEGNEGDHRAAGGQSRGCTGTVRFPAPERKYSGRRDGERHAHRRRGAGVV